MKRVFPERRVVRLGAVVRIIPFIAIVYLLLAYGVYAAFTSQIPSGNDFYPRWRGTKALVVEGRDPYSDEVTLDIQQGMYGRPAREDEDQVGFAYPLYVSLLLLPFALLPYPFAQALWVSALILTILAALLVILRTLEWHPSPLGLVGLALWSVLFYPSARSIILGQISIVVLALVALALWTLEQRYEALAGCLLAASTIKPQMVFLIVPFLLLVSLRRGARKTIVAFLCTMVVLVLLCLIVLPTWIPSFLAGLGSYQSYTSIYREGNSPLGVIFAYLLPSGLAVPVAGLVSMALVACLAYTWIVSIRQQTNTYRTLFLTIVTTLLIPAQTGTTNQVLLLLPIIYLLARYPGNWAIRVALPSLLLVGPWLLFLLAFPAGNGEHAILSVPLPILTLAILPWTAHRAHFDVESS
ncbi:MAG TPA: glycosyltransferase 87 family protein [Anaerolineae bacterium]|nr:glycosyltransferase 87 family protein [Anaerolineae bacterium]